MTVSFVKDINVVGEKMTRIDVQCAYHIVTNRLSDSDFT